jgi:hypothetical protein
VISVVPSIAWTFYADSIKEKSILTEWLTSANLRNWNFGTIAQRFIVGDWADIFSRFWLLGGLSLLVLFPTIVVVTLNKNNFMRLILACFLTLLAPLVFFNLYVVHDYYFMAVLFPAVLSFSYLLHGAQKKFLWNTNNISMFFVILIFLLPSWIFTVQNRDYGALIKSPRSDVPSISTEIKENTLSSDRILVVGCDWDPTVLFYADRYGIAVPGWIGSTDEGLRIMRETALKELPKFLAICGSNLPPSNPDEENLTRVSENIWRINSEN